MHKNTKLTEPLRREVYRRWKEEDLSLRKLGELYHVDKKVIQRVIERGKKGDFAVRDSTNKRYRKGGSKK